MTIHFHKINIFLIGVVVLLNVNNMAGIDVPEFFPEINGDLTLVTWAHAVNSNSALQTALDGDVMMLEADVSLGTLIGGDGELIPIMAHPPTVTSDLSLAEFLRRVIEVRTKGIKLDFKSTEALAPSLAILSNNSEQFVFPVWLNADIYRGPALQTGNPVDPNVFLRSCAEDFPTSTLSVGWTTTWGPLYTTGSYTENDVREMLQGLSQNNITQRVTFPVRGGIAAYSPETLTSIVTSVANSTLTVWGSESDAVDFEKLANLILTVGKDAVYIDLPESVRAELDQWLNQLEAKKRTARR